MKTQEEIEEILRMAKLSFTSTQTERNPNGNRNAFVCVDILNYILDNPNRFEIHMLPFLLKKYGNKDITVTE